MKDFWKIAKKNGKVKINDLKGYPLLGKGGDGWIFQLTEDKCVKIFKNENTQKLELEALLKGQSSSVIPRVYEYGSNYIVMELIDGHSLPDYLRKEKKLSASIVLKIIFMLEEMKRIGFTRLDTEIRHIFLNLRGEIRVIDLKKELNISRSVPTKLLMELKEMGFMREFLEHVKTLRPDLYKEWKNLIK